MKTLLDISVIGLTFLILSTTGSETTFPSETDPHDRTFMCWPQELDVWDDKLKDVQSDVLGIATALSEFETVTLLVDPKSSAKVREQIPNKNSKIKIMEIPTNDLWARDTVPVFVLKNDKSNTSIVGIDFNFNGWGGKQEPRDSDGRIGQELLKELKIERRETWLVTEGGSLETDGEGTLLVTESSIINENRNPGKSKKDIEKELKELLGVTKIIWFKGVKGKDITDAHVDCVVRFVKPGRVIVNRPNPDEEDKNDVWTKSSNEAVEVLNKETDAKGRKFEIVKLFEASRDKIQESLGSTIPDSFVASYVNFFIANGGIIMPKFGDEDSDTKAMKVLQEQFPGRKVVAVNITTLAGGGGGIHCATHELPIIGNSGSLTSEFSKLLLILAMINVIVKSVL